MTHSVRCRLLAAMLLAILAGPNWAEPPGPVLPDATLAAPCALDTTKGAPPAPLTLSEAVTWALQRNPQLATLRQQRGIAAAAVVIARTYPFNPVVQDFVLADNGPASSGVTNHVFNEHYFRLDLEVHGQGRHRRAAAAAALTRTEADIAAQELALAVQVVRAFDAYLYRRAQVQLAAESLHFQEETLQRVTRLAEQGGAGPADLILARADLAEGRAAQGPARATLDQSRNALRRLLGLVDEPLDVQGKLAENAPALEPAALTERAVQGRPDLQSLRLAVQEAEARRRLEIANRWGNPSLGPAFEYNETRDYFIGLVAVWPIPIFNRRQGEIQQRQAERDRAAMAVQQGEIQARQDVQAALTRLRDAVDLVQTFRKTTLPALEEARDAVDRLFAQGRQGADLSRVLETRRRLLRARGTYLDALWELSQARADLAAAVGDPFLTVIAPVPANPSCAPHLP